MLDILYDSNDNEKAEQVVHKSGGEFTFERKDHQLLKKSTFNKL